MKKIMYLIALIGLVGLFSSIAYYADYQTVALILLGVTLITSILAIVGLGRSTEVDILLDEISYYNLNIKIWGFAIALYLVIICMIGVEYRDLWMGEKVILINFLHPGFMITSASLIVGGLYQSRNLVKKTNT